MDSAASVKAMSPAKGRVTCPQCGNAFVCEVQAGSERCWCFDLPPVNSVVSDVAKDASCLCRNCLQQRVQGQA